MELYIFRQFNNIKISNIHIDAILLDMKNINPMISKKYHFKIGVQNSILVHRLEKFKLILSSFLNVSFFHHSRINNHIFIKRIFSLSYFPISHFLKNLHYIIRRIRLYNVVRVKWKLARRHILKSFVTVLVRSIGDKKGQVEFMKKYCCL